MARRKKICRFALFIFGKYWLYSASIVLYNVVVYCLIPSGIWLTANSDKNSVGFRTKLNASDDRGIGIVRGPILNFASTRTIFSILLYNTVEVSYTTERPLTADPKSPVSVEDASFKPQDPRTTKGFKLVILDEADAMTRDAQDALRRVIEKFTENTRFCIICNYLTKITPALQSRCTRFRFGPLGKEQMIPRLQHVVAEENVMVTPEGEKALVTLANGDMRKVLNILQSCSMAYDTVTEDNVYTCVGHPLRRDIENIVDWMLNSDFRTAYNNISNVKIAKGLALQDILTEVHLYVHRIDFPIHVKIHLLEKMADVEHRLASGTSEKIQLSSLIAAFQVARDMVAQEAS